MTKEMIIEAVGYLGSLLVLVSFLMTSVIRLRIVNTIGSVIFMIYAIIIHSYPTAVMNFCLVLINLRFLWKSRKTDEQIDLIHAGKDDRLLSYLLEHYEQDIKACFPGISYDLNEANRIYVVSIDGKPAGITLGKREGDAMELLLDYSIPAYRDFSIGAYLLEKYRQEGIRRLVYGGPVENHVAYLTKLGFVEKNGRYIREL
ncbi:MAG: YgjV family protein [Erysipelotrichaceae bacterium]|nr:YgjV family protein [Erysipelotrichaceae bacterium]